MSVSTSLKVGTFNLFHDFPRCLRLGERLGIFANAIALHTPDAVALQEVLRTAACGNLVATIERHVNRACGTTAYVIEHVVADGTGDGDYRFEEGSRL